MLIIENLHAAVKTVNAKEKANTPILRGLNLQIKPGEVHAIMGPNGSGKSTLSRVLIGDETYSVTQGRITLDDEDLLPLPIEIRAQRGLFLSFQYPVALPGVSNIQFLKTAINHIRAAQGLEPFDAMDLLEQAQQALTRVGLDDSFIQRAVNDGFSGGEKKRNELVQLLLMKPKLAILDEIDSGMDIDALKIVTRCIEELRNSGTAFLLITHYKRLLEAVQPDHVHLLRDGVIEASGDMSLAERIERDGYAGDGYAGSAA